MVTDIAMTKYIVITPARDEEEFIEKTILAVANQTIKPAQWIIVNDGSSDRTGEIVDDLTRIYPWITTRHRSNRGHREAGGGVIHTFYDGYALIKPTEW